MQRRLPTLLNVALYGVAVFLLVPAVALHAQQAPADALDESGVRGGLVVHVGCGDGSGTVALRRSGAFLVQGLAATEDLAVARAAVRDAGAYGPVSVRAWSADRLPYADNLVNLLVVEAGFELAEAEALRVLSPGGVAMFRAGDGWRRLEKPRADDIDEWTHYLHGADNNAVAADRVVGPPRRVQWMGDPQWDRHHEHMGSTSAMVAMGGRVFYITDEGSRVSIHLPPKWRLVARDAFSGVVLWKRDLDSWHSALWSMKSGPFQLARRLVAVDGRVYVTLGLDSAVSVLDPATGDVAATFEATRGTRELVVADGRLFCLTEDAPEWVAKVRGYRPAPESEWYGHEIKRSGEFWNHAAEQAVVAVDVESGAELWRRSGRFAEDTLIAHRGRCLVVDGGDVVALGAAIGEERWRESQVSPKPGLTLMAKDDVVVAAGAGLSPKYMQEQGMAEPPEGKLIAALSLETGELLWTAPQLRSGHYSPGDCFVVGDRVWTGETSVHRAPTYRAHDLHTGELVTTFKCEERNFWFHRCTRSKATERFVLASSTGLEFVDLENERFDLNNWVRGACMYGVMPANGMLYKAPDPCACYMESKINGFLALAPEGEPVDAAPDRLVKGPAYATAFEPVGGEMGWPTYRADAMRSSAYHIQVPRELDTAWEVDLGRPLSGVTVAGGLAFVAAVDAHTVHAIDIRTGEKRWNYTAGARVDSPPTVCWNRVFFGSADGYVHCVSLSDGAHAWSYRAAPADRMVVVRGQLESTWPVHGSVLVLDNVVWAVAGRLRFLDGGMRLVRLDAGTGELLSETVLDESWDAETSVHDLHNRQIMPVSSPDILSSDGRFVYMRSQAFDLDGNPVTPDFSLPHYESDAAKRHIFPVNGFLDDSWFHRTYWIYGSHIKSGNMGWYMAPRYAPSGRLLALAGDTVFGFGRTPHGFMWRDAQAYHIWAAATAIRPERIEQVKAVVDGKDTAYRIARHRSLMDARDVAEVSAVDFKWSLREPPLYGRSVVVAGDTVVVAGVPKLLDENALHENPTDRGLLDAAVAQQEAFDGERGGVLMVLGAADGAVLSRRETDFAPAWDGGATAYGRLYLATTDGRLVCLGRVGDE